MPNASEILSKFDRGPLRWRAVNNHPLQMVSRTNGFYNVQNLAAFFKNGRNFSFQWLFLHNANSSVWDNILKDMPLDLITRNMINLARPVYTDFTETNKDEDFTRISADFYRELFWVEKIYLSFDFFTNPDNYIYEGRETPKEIKHLAELGGFDLWLKLTGDDLDDDLGFMHIRTGICVKIPDWRNKMAIAEWCGDEVQNFLNWFEYSVEYLASLKKLDKFARLLVKRVRMEASGKNSTEAILDLEAKLGNINSSISVNPDHNADIIAVEYANGADLESLHRTTFNTLDRRAYELGRVANTNPKGERLTSGENYKDISAVANRQKATLERLEHFANQVKKLFGKELNFCVSGIPEKEMLPTENATAPNPNTEGSSAGGVGGAGGMR